MTDLSPQAQAVLDAANGKSSWGPDDILNDSRWIAAAALRAAADQVVPDIGYEADCLNEPVESELQCVRTRFFAIAAELEGANA